MQTDMRLAIRIGLLSLEQVQIDGEAPRNQEERQRDDHGMAGADVVGHIAQDSGDDGAAADGGDEERRAALGVAAQAAQGQREDGREDAALEEEHQHQHREAAPVRPLAMACVGADGRADEHHDQGLVRQQDVPRLRDVHQPRGGEAADGEERLRDGVEVCALVLRGDGRDVWARLGVEVDEVARDADLGADIGELRCYAPEQRVLLAHRLVFVAGG